MLQNLLQFHASGHWPRGRVGIKRAPSSRPVIPEIEALIARAWADALARPGVQLFNGPMCRLESWHSTPARLDLVLSDTSYKPFLGTNLSHPGLADRFGRAALANPVGVSPALLTADGFIMMGRRNASVAYYPNRVHPFAGALDPADASVFDAVERELAEELAFTPADIAGITCTGIAEDRSIRQPELIFTAITRLGRADVEARLDPAEHHGVWAVEATAEAVARAIRAAGDAFTPVALAALGLWGRNALGEAWFSGLGE